MLLPHQRENMVTERMHQLWLDAGEPEGQENSYRRQAGKEIDAEESFGPDYLEREAEAARQAEAEARRMAREESDDEAKPRDDGRIEKERLEVDVKEPDHHEPSRRR